MISDISKSLSEVCNLFFVLLRSLLRSTSGGYHNFSNCFHNHYSKHHRFCDLILVSCLNMLCISDRNDTKTNHHLCWHQLHESHFPERLAPKVFLLESNDCLLPNDRRKATDFLKKHLKGFFLFFFNQKHN